MIALLVVTLICVSLVTSERSDADYASSWTDIEKGYSDYPERPDNYSLDYNLDLETRKKIFIPKHHHSIIASKSKLCLFQ